MTYLLGISRSGRAWWTAGLLFVMPLVGRGQSITWHQPTLLEAGTGSPRGPLIAVAGQQVVAVWGRSATQRIEAAASTNGGASWQAPHVIDSGAGAASTPQFSLAGHRAVAVWVQDANKTFFIGTSCSTNGGNSWLPAQRLSRGTGRVTDAHVALSGSQAVAAWVREEDGAYTLVTARSTDGGVTWSEPQTVSVGTGKVADTYVAITGQQVVIIWGQDLLGTGMSLFSSCSADGGEHWLAPQRIDASTGKVYPGVSWAYCPQVAMAGHNAIAVWCQEQQGRRTIFVNHSGDSGKTWAGAQSFGGTYFPHIVMSDTTAVAVWVSGAILSSYSTDGGATWQPAKPISMGWRIADNPSVTISGTRVVAAWRQHDGTQLSAFANVSTDGGQTWQTPQELDTSSAMGWYPAVAVDGEQVAALWMQMTPEWNWSLFTTYSASGGQSWQSPRVVATGSSDAGAPRVALADARALMVWPALDQDQWLLRAAYSTDRGETWHPSPFVAAGTSPGNSVAAALAGPRAVAVWRQCDGAATGNVATARSDDGGATWQPAEKPIAAANGSELTAPAVAISGAEPMSRATTVAVWRRHTRETSAIDAACSIDNGRSWETPQTIFTGADATEPQVAVHGTQVVATWVARTDNGLAAFVAHSADGGRRWEKAQALQPGSKLVGGPRVAVAGNRAVVVWQQHDGEANRIYASCSTDNGKSWSRAAPVETGFGNAWGPTVNFVDGRILVIWRQHEERATALTEYSHQSMQNTQYGCYSADDGQTWSAPRVIGSGFGESVTPVLAIDGARVLAGYMNSEGTFWSLSANTGPVFFPKAEGK